MEQIGTNTSNESNKSRTIQDKKYSSNFDSTSNETEKTSKFLQSMFEDPEETSHYHTDSSNPKLEEINVPEWQYSNQDPSKKHSTESHSLKSMFFSSKQPQSRNLSPTEPSQKKPSGYNYSHGSDSSRKESDDSSFNSMNQSPNDSRAHSNKALHNMLKRMRMRKLEAEQRQQSSSVKQKSSTFIRNEPPSNFYNNSLHSETNNLHSSSSLNKNDDNAINQDYYSDRQNSEDFHRNIPQNEYSNNEYSENSYDDQKRNSIDINAFAPSSKQEFGKLGFKALAAEQNAQSHNILKKRKLQQVSRIKYSTYHPSHQDSSKKYIKNSSISKSPNLPPPPKFPPSPEDIQNHYISNSHHPKKNAVNPHHMGFSQPESTSERQSESYPPYSNRKSNQNPAKYTPNLTKPNSTGHFTNRGQKSIDVNSWEKKAASTHSNNPLSNLHHNLDRSYSSKPISQNKQPNSSYLDNPWKKNHPQRLIDHFKPTQYQNLGFNSRTLSSSRVSSSQGNHGFQSQIKKSKSSHWIENPSTHSKEWIHEQLQTIKLTEPVKYLVLTILYENEEIGNSQLLRKVKKTGRYMGSVALGMIMFNLIELFGEKYISRQKEYGEFVYQIAEEFKPLLKPLISG